jgi:hypothetical protein
MVSNALTGDKLCVFTPLQPSKISAARSPYFAQSIRPFHVYAIRKKVWTARLYSTNIK